MKKKSFFFPITQFFKSEIIKSNITDSIKYGDFQKLEEYITQDIALVKNLVLQKKIPIDLRYVYQNFPADKVAEAIILLTKVGANFNDLYYDNPELFYLAQAEVNNIEFLLDQILTDPNISADIKYNILLPLHLFNQEAISKLINKGAIINQTISIIDQTFDLFDYSIISKSDQMLIALLKRKDFVISNNNNFNQIKLLLNTALRMQHEEKECYKIVEQYVANFIESSLCKKDFLKNLIEEKVPVSQSQKIFKACLKNLDVNIDIEYHSIFSKLTKVSLLEYIILTNNDEALSMILQNPLLDLNYNIEPNNSISKILIHKFGEEVFANYLLNNQMICAKFMEYYSSVQSDALINLSKYAESTGRLLPVNIKYSDGNTLAYKSNNVDLLKILLKNGYIPREEEISEFQTTKLNVETSAQAAISLLNQNNIDKQDFLSCKDVIKEKKYSSITEGQQEIFALINKVFENTMPNNLEYLKFLEQIAEYYNNLGESKEFLEDIQIPKLEQEKFTIALDTKVLDTIKACNFDSQIVEGPVTQQMIPLFNSFEEVEEVQKLGDDSFEKVE